MRVRRTASLGALALAGITAVGAVVVRHRDLGPGLERVAPQLRAPLLVIGRGPTGPAETLPEDYSALIASTLPNRVFPAAGGRYETLTDRGVEVGAWIYDARREPDGMSDDADDAPTHAGRPGVVWIHGGGYIGGTPAQDHALCARIARETGGVVVSVDYRLAPAHRFPAALDDCATALAWLRAHAEELGVDRTRIAVGGASAGGGLAACLAQLAHDEGEDLAFQLLIYPMLDDRTGADGVEVPGRGEYVWTARRNAEGWGAYLGHPAGGPEDRAYASPARREDLTGLPDAWIGVGDLDLFLDEDLAYAERLRQAGASVQVHVERGMYHGADFCVWAPAMRDFRTEAIDALHAALRR